VVSSFSVLKLLLSGFWDCFRCVCVGVCVCVFCTVVDTKPSEIKNLNVDGRLLCIKRNDLHNQ